MCRSAQSCRAWLAVKMCFDADVVYHLFIARGEEFENVDLKKSFEFETRKAGWTVSKWESGGHVFVLTAKASQENLESMLAEYTP
jgi:hypothetical protein